MNPSVILYPVGASGIYTAAFDQAVALARWFQADLHVTFVQRPQPAHQSLLESVDTDGLRLVVNTLSGPAIPAVVEYALAVSADLIVIEMEPRRYGLRWRRVLDVDTLVGMVDCPMLVVPAGAPNGQPKNSFSQILCPTDVPVDVGSAFREALSLAQHGGGKLTLLHALEGFPYQPVYSSGGAINAVREYRERVALASRRMSESVPGEALNWCQVKVKVVSGAAHRAILTTALEMKADLIVVGCARPGASRLAQSAARTVIQSAMCPVLVVPPGAPSFVVKDRHFKLNDGHPVSAVR